MGWRRRRPTRFSKSRRRSKANPIRVPKVEAQRNSSSSPPRSPGAACTKFIAQVAYGLGFRLSTYAWKAKEISFPMALVPPQNSFRVIRNRRNKSTSRIYQVAAPPSFGLLARVSCWGPLWTWLGGYARPNPHIISSRCHIRVWVLLRLIC